MTNVPPIWSPIDSRDWICIFCHKRGVLEVRSVDLGNNLEEVHYRCRDCGKVSIDEQPKESESV